MGFQSSESVSDSVCGRARTVTLPAPASREQEPLEQYQQRRRSCPSQSLSLTRETCRCARQARRAKGSRVRRFVFGVSLINCTVLLLATRQRVASKLRRE